MDYTVEHIAADRAVVSLSGRLDAGATPEIKSRLKKIARERTAHLVLDMSRVDFIDSNGLGGLVAVFKTVRERQGSLVLASVAGPVRAALELTYLDRVFVLTEDRASALAHLDKATTT